VGVAKATKATKATKRMVQHTWKVTRRNGQSVEITADNLTVTYGDLVFSTKGVVVRVIGVDTYNDVELVSPLEP
jgi:magnesium-transporting ATPase (P-type)